MNLTHAIALGIALLGLSPGICAQWVQRCEGPLAEVTYTAFNCPDGYVSVAQRHIPASLGNSRAPSAPQGRSTPIAAHKRMPSAEKQAASRKASELKPAAIREKAAKTSKPRKPVKYRTTQP
jgi:hypothetical protein